MKWISTQIIFTFLILLVPANVFSFNYSVNTLHLADSLYSKQNFGKAQKYYIEALNNNNRLKSDPNLNFKMAYCYFKNGYYSKAISIFENRSILNGLLPLYTDYFKFKSLLKLNKIEIFSVGNQFLQNNADHFLADSVRFLLAEYHFQKGRYYAAYNFYSGLYSKKSKSFKKSYLEKQLALCKYELNEKENAVDRIVQILKKYPASSESLELVHFLEERRLDSEDMFFSIMEVYLKNRKYKFLNKKLEAYIQSSNDRKLIEKARYYLLLVYFSKREYHSALYGFQELKKNLINEKLKPRILVYIARCFLRLNEKEKSAKTYIEYSKQFPRRRLAAETAWKAAWIYEEIYNLGAALNQYRNIQKHWPRSSFRYEAKFREGFTLFRMKHYSKAEMIFREIINSRWNQSHKDRSKYWLGLTCQQQKREKESYEIFIDLGKNLFDNYYSTKAFLNNKSYFDSTMKISSKLSMNDNPLEKYVSSFGFNMDKYVRLFQIFELLGSDYVLDEIAAKRYRPSDMNGWITMAEVYKKLGDYNGSFKIYDLIDYKYFGEYDILDKPFLLKEKYPFYYDTHIDKYCKKRNLEKNLILAIIREESGFNRNARSWANAYGLMQIIPRTAKELSFEIKKEYSSPQDLYNEELNLELGIYYVSKLGKKYGNKKEYILAAYNAGPHRMDRWEKWQNNKDIDYFIENIEFSQTRNYVKKVMKNYWIYSILNGIY